MLRKNELKALQGAVSKDQTRMNLSYAFGADYAGVRYVAATDGSILVAVPYAGCPLGPVLLGKDGRAMSLAGESRSPDVSAVIPTNRLSGKLDLGSNKFAWTRKLGRVSAGPAPGVALGLSLDGPRACVSKVLMSEDFAEDADERPYVDAALFGRCLLAFEDFADDVCMDIGGRLDPVKLSRVGGPIAVVMPVQMRQGYK